MMQKSGKAMIHKGDKHSEKAVSLVEGAQEVRDLCRAAGLNQKNVKNAFKSVVGGGVLAFASHRHGSHEEKEQILAMMSGPGSNALRVRGFSILPFKEHVKRVSRRHDNPDSRIEAMEAVVTSVKGAYYPHQINVAAWDVGLGMEEPECYDMLESGTAKNPDGLAYRYAVFRGQGVIKWKGGLQTGVPDVCCTGNLNMGPDSVWFSQILY
ncbi:unnamed protein product [Ectocarpus sp. 12 AP-2014]